jgi:ABC-type uncharacterized transport system substrate-binding protein
MDRRAFIAVMGGSILAAPLAAKAREAVKTYRIGWLAYGWTEGAERTSPEFVQELKKHLQNFVFEFRGHRDAERMPGLARELVQLGVDVIVANGTVAAQAARSVTQSVPIVFLISGDPVGSGLVTSLARPGGNVTGPSAMSSDFATKRLELFKHAIPSLNRVGVLSTSYDGAAALASWNGIEAAASQAGLQVQRITARGPADFESAFATVSKEKIDGLLIIDDPRFVAARNRFAAAYCGRSCERPGDAERTMGSNRWTGMSTRCVSIRATRRVPKPQGGVPRARPLGGSLRVTSAAEPPSPLIAARDLRWKRSDFSKHCFLENRP